ncbi:TIGR04013 family B12-binding domain/radical SAM domain-containing protein [Pyxidicoccus parkwayensis]|uniref:TIGR04013 family B12-binding domain/radical SAM domain-containing protein n=1 Tax=Pyxidicoccus parkwayensis TaxID=2813578 RepID=A0ABX7NVM1_9BACT|nr:TIGR04013 family B12-binding domain/radical SAM domain-containing protein [Pyxidicoccus parkwaysis]QSQ22965.1 TIGR04013 family B12-binding domain/radical SAM domain-containing protein [Pyxidicoccus parkwaysis]
MESHRRVALVLSYQYPGKYAFTVLAGAVESDPALSGVSLHFPRDRETLLSTLRERADAGDTVVAAWSFYSASFGPSAEELAWVRERLEGRDVLCIAGGVHATAEPLQTLQAGFDLIAVGEGEHSLREVLLRVQRGEDPRATHGIAYLEDGKLKQNGRGEGVSLDDFPPFAVRHGQYGAIEITRGCIYACRFCQTPFMSKARFRHRSVANVAHWARELRRSGRRDIRFITPTSMSYGTANESVNLAAVEELLAAVREAMAPDGRIYYGTFPSEVRPEHVTPEALALLKRYVHNDNLIIGGQSGSERILQSTRRGHDVETVVRATRLAVEGGFIPNVDFILGLPGEESSDVEATVALMEQLAALGARVHGHTFMPLPGTPFRDAPAGHVDAETQRKLDRLASQGRLYGHWKHQAVLAEGIVSRRKPRATRAHTP